MVMEPVQVVVVDQTGNVHELEGLAGWRLMEVIRDYGLPIKAECGGACACATCHVYVDKAWQERLPALDDNEEEQDMLDEAFEVEEGRSRLSCQIILDPSLEGLKVTLAPGSEPEETG